MVTRSTTTLRSQHNIFSMRLHNMLPFRRHLLGLALLSSASIANAAQEYCSSQNTGSALAEFSIYQSNGRCSDTCRSEYAFAIVQYQNCWCSNYAPASQEDVSNCSQHCPGYPQELCGNEDEGLYGYIALSNQPSGTAGASSASNTSPSNTQSSTIQSPSSSPTPSSTSQEESTSITTRSTSSPSTTSSSSRSIPSTTEPPTPVTSIIQTTVSGQVVTRTVTSTPVVAPNSGSDNIQIERKEGLSGGAVAGIVIGVVAGLALLAVAAFLLWRRRKTAENGEAAGAGSDSKKNMTRNVSVLSKAGLLSRGNRTSMGERELDDPYALNGSNSVRHSMLFGPGAEGVSPTSPLGSSHGESASSRRPSKPMVYDQRLNPSALFSNSEANGSRISMQDTQDYSRPLGVTNPDPRPSFESRTSNYRA